jgi:exodeoxyribonuclease V gamma subunit
MYHERGQTSLRDHRTIKYRSVMMHIIKSNQQEELCTRLASSIKGQKGQLFSKTVIVTQTDGMKAWLKKMLAIENRILANFEFLNQEGLYARIHQIITGEPLQNNTDIIKYRIFELLDSAGFIDAFPEVAAYYEKNERRRFQLAVKIADLLDQYQLYRPQWIKQWEAGKKNSEHVAEDWQRWIWLQLDVKSRSDERDALIREMEIKKDILLQRYPMVSLFGITVMTEFHLTFFKALSKYIELNIYLNLPSESFTYKNGLLDAFGNKAKELAELLNIEEVPVTTADNSSFLGNLQNQIFHNRENSLPPPDHSIHINACYTHSREVECLYNYLIDLFDKDRSLKPGDVLVMCPDIESYAPFIKTIFSNGPVKIPRVVSGLPAASEDSITGALNKLLEFRPEEFTSEKVMNLLEQKRLKKRFNIKETKPLREAVRKANIRFGYENSKHDDSIFAGWKYGLEKILLGYAILSEEAHENNDGTILYPFRDMEGGISYELLNLKLFVEKLNQSIRERNTPKSLLEWKTWFLETILQEMVHYSDFEKEDREEIAAIHKKLAGVEDCEVSGKVGFYVFLEELRTRLFREKRETKLATGNVTVSPPVEVRGIPFKVICFIGLNNNEFPRKELPAGFDLIASEKEVMNSQPGDRDILETDKYLFLDTLLSVREKIYFSYIGKNVKDNSDIPPSIVIDILLSHIGTEGLALQHPLHGFSKQYNGTNEKLYTYLYGKEGDIVPYRENTTHDLPKEVPLDSFIKVFEHPIQWYFNKMMGIYLDNHDDTLPETELTEPDSLELWQIKRDLMELEETDLDAYFEKATREGKLPLKNKGLQLLNDTSEEIRPTREKYRELTSEITETTAEIDLQIGGIRLKGLLGGIFNGKLITYTFSDKPKYDVRSFLQALLLTADSKINAACLINSKGVEKEITIGGSEEAKEKISMLLEWFLKGNLTPLLFLPSATKLKKGEEFTTEAVIGKFRQEITTNRNKTWKDPYLEILFREGVFNNFGDAELEDFIKIGQLVNLIKEQ